MLANHRDYSWLPCVEAEAIATLQKLVESPDSVGAEARRSATFLEVESSAHLLHRYPGSIALALTYGKRAESYDKADASGFNLRQYAEVSESLIAMTEPGGQSEIFCITEAHTTQQLFPWTSFPSLPKCLPSCNPGVHTRYI